MPIPPLGSCRGNSNRLRILAKFDVWPLAHQKIVNGTPKAGCAGPLTDRYYMFGYRLLGQPSSSPFEIFFCGDTCGDDFLVRLGDPAFPLFNPLNLPPSPPASPSTSASVASLGIISAGASAAGAAAPTPTWDPLNREIYTVINLLVAFGGVTPASYTLETLQWIEKYPASTCYAFRVERLNNYVGTMVCGSLQNELTVLRAGPHPTLRIYGFPLIRAVLAAHTNYIDP